MKNDKYHHWKAYITLLLESETNLQFFWQIVNMFAKQKYPKKS